MSHRWSSPSTTPQIQEGITPTKRWKKVMDTASKWLGIEENGEWLKDMRGNLAMVATVIATMIFQVGLNPPGGVVQNDERGYVACPTNQPEYYTDYACPREFLQTCLFEPLFEICLCVLKKKNLFKPLCKMNFYKVICE